MDERGDEAMSAKQRVKNVLIGLVMLALSVILFLDPSDGFSVVAMLLTFTLIFFGLRCLFFYLTMARHMVGGRSMLYVGIITLDLGVFFTTLSDVPKLYIVLYLLLIHAFDGAVKVMRSLEARRYGSAWRLNLSVGLVNLVMAVLCVVFLHRPNMIVWIYSTGLVYSGCVRIATAFRRTAVVYIQ